jgi:hypothetical protein
MRSARLLTFTLVVMGLLLTIVYMLNRLVVGDPPDPSKPSQNNTNAGISRGWTVDGNDISSPSEIFMLAAPSGWKVLKDPADGTVSIISPASDANDSFQENVTVAAYPFIYAVTFESYFNRTTDQLDELMENYTEEARGKWQLPSAEGYVAVYQRTRDGKRYKHISWSALHDGKVLTMAAVAPAETFDKYSADFEAIASSVKIKKRRGSN